MGLSKTMVSNIHIKTKNTAGITVLFIAYIALDSNVRALSSYHIEKIIINLFINL